MSLFPRQGRHAAIATTIARSSKSAANPPSPPSRSALRAVPETRCPDGVSTEQISRQAGFVPGEVISCAGPFLPGKAHTVWSSWRTLKQHEFSLDGGAVLEHCCVYVVTAGDLDLPPSLALQPKELYGLIDVFTRLSRTAARRSLVGGKLLGELFGRSSATFSVN